ncbi:hypothetical protein B0H17DRAFT_1037313 [Mycena rosella]|uniref:Uncharacterized protein n=1 Tax=Mycena rosella TaxID=1033263 RepID=A0AAD7M9D7_MYCRO|nr:hypothetical protein B0H17DRAFT_1037313 [Mycena rosella]
MLGSPSPSTSDEKVSSPRPCSPPPAAQSSAKNPPRNRPLAELIGAPFPAFDYETTVILPFQDETSRDESFQKELNKMLLDATLEAHAWASARPFHETDLATRKFEQEILSVQEQEREQGMYLTTRPPPSFLFLLFGRRILPPGLFTSRFTVFLDCLLILAPEKTRQRLNEFVTRLKSALAALTMSM